MNWTKLGLNLLTALPKIQQTVEALKDFKSGEHKKDAVLTAILNSLDVAQTITDQNVLTDPRVMAAVAKANDVAIEVQNVIAHVMAERSLR